MGRYADGFLFFEVHLLGDKGNHTLTETQLTFFSVTPTYDLSIGKSGATCRFTKRQVNGMSGHVFGCHWGCAGVYPQRKSELACTVVAPALHRACRQNCTGMIATRIEGSHGFIKRQGLWHVCLTDVSFGSGSELAMGVEPHTEGVA